MDIIVIGCGRLGSVLATRLDKNGHKVSVINSDPASFNNLPPDFNGRTHEGDALMQDVLIRAGIEHAQAIAVVTNSDALNVVIAHVARETYSVPNVVARNYSPRNLLLFEEMNIQVVSSTTWGAQRVEEMLLDSDIRVVFSAGNGEIEIYEFLVPEEWHGKALAEFKSDHWFLPVAVTRAGKSMLPDSDLILEKGDVVHFSATFDGANRLCMMFRGEKEK